MKKLTFPNKMLWLFVALNASITVLNSCNKDDDERSNSKDDGVMINGVKWATRNVAAPGTFANNPEDFGMYYQWNSKVGWSLSGSTDGSSWNGSWNGNNASSWQTENNPCPVGWRVPTQAELASLTGVGSYWTVVNDMFGRQFGSGKNTIFLPATGGRDYYSGSLDYTGTHGYYWSSSRDGYAKGLLVTDDDINPNQAHYSSSGLCVRCVAE